MEIWFAAWCKADGSVIAEAFGTFDSAYSYYCRNPHGLSDNQLKNCQWRGVLNQDVLARHIAKIT